jgi:hypothetical protein
MNELDFNLECQTLGAAFARAKLRLDEKAPPAFKAAYQSYRGLRAFPSYFDRKCLSLRFSAVKRGMVLDPQVDANFLETITPKMCPVTLQQFVIDAKSSSNPSLDRLVNEGTYAAGNVAMFSLRANRAKGEKTFEQVATIAANGEPLDGLESIEWMRLASLMYGAWSIAVRKADPYLLPLATYPAPKAFTSESQLVQWMLLRHCRNDVWPQSMAVWKDATIVGGSSLEQFMEFASALHGAAHAEAFPPTAWLYPAVFDGFVSWYSDCRPAISALMESFRQRFLGGVDPEAIAEHWRVGSRYLV